MDQISKGRTKIWPYILDPGPIYAEGQNFRDRPRASRFIFNTYRGWSSFILNSSNETIPCREGIVQGDSLSMFIYAIATIPFIRELESTTSATQLWYADIFAALGDHPSLRFWFDRLQEVVPYLVTSLSMVRAPDCPWGFNWWCNKCILWLWCYCFTSCRFLGGVVGDASGQDSFVPMKTAEWESYVRKLAWIAEDHPQEAYIALTKSLQISGHFCKGWPLHWSYVLWCWTLPLIRFYTCSTWTWYYSPGPLTFLSPCQAWWVEHKNPTVNIDTLYQASRRAT